jgi:hypothetical protein
MSNRCFAFYSLALQPHLALPWFPTCGHRTFSRHCMQVGRRSKQAGALHVGTTSNHRRSPLFLHTFTGKQPYRLQIFRIGHPQDHFLCSCPFVFSQPLANHLGCADKSLFAWKRTPCSSASMRDRRGWRQDLFFVNWCYGITRSSIKHLGMVQRHQSSGPLRNGLVPLTVSLHPAAERVVGRGHAARGAYLWNGQD